MLKRIYIAVGNDIIERTYTNFNMSSFDLLTRLIVEFGDEFYGYADNYEDAYHLLLAEYLPEGETLGNISDVHFLENCLAKEA